MRERSAGAEPNRLAADARFAKRRDNKEKPDGSSEQIQRDACAFLTPELGCKGTYKNARAASIINSSFDSFSVR